jgi:hypothetical protein
MRAHGSPCCPLPWTSGADCLAFPSQRKGSSRYTGGRCVPSILAGRTLSIAAGAWRLSLRPALPRWLCPAALPGSLHPRPPGPLPAALSRPIVKRDVVSEVDWPDLWPVTCNAGWGAEYMNLTLGRSPTRPEGGEVVEDAPRMVRVTDGGQRGGLGRRLPLHRPPAGAAHPPGTRCLGCAATSYRRRAVARLGARRRGTVGARGGVDPVPTGGP